jgi:cytochrome P450
MAKFGDNKIRKRRAKTALSATGEEDFLSKFLKAAKVYPQTVDDRAIVSYTVTNLVAGSDTTATSLRAASYYLLKHPDCFRRLQEETDNTELPEGPAS